MGENNIGHYNKLVFEIGFCSKVPAKYLSVEQKIQAVAKRKFYECSSEYNYFSYVLNENKIKTEKNKDIREYMTRNGDTESRVTGLFNASGEISSEKFEEIKQQLAKTDSHIWHGFLSFDTETSKGFNTTEDGIRFLKQSFDSFLDKTHLQKDNLELFAVMHKDTDNRHIHFCFFEKEAKKLDKNGKLGYTSKGVIWENAITNYRVNANMYLHDSREYYTARDRAIEKLKQFRSNAVKTLTSKEVQIELAEVSKALPRTGKTGYSTLDKELQKRVDKIVPMLFSQNYEAFKAFQEIRLQFANRRNIFDEVVKSNANSYAKIDIDKYLPYMNKLYNDLNIRFGNQVIAIAKSMNKDYCHTRKAKSTKLGIKIDAKKRRQHRDRVFGRALKNLGVFSQSVKSNWIYEMRRIEQEIAQANRNEHHLLADI